MGAVKSVRPVGSFEERGSPIASRVSCGSPLPELGGPGRRSLERCAAFEMLIAPRPGSGPLLSNSVKESACSTPNGWSTSPGSLVQSDAARSRC